MTSEVLSQSRCNGSSDAFLDREVADFMTPGCVVISEAASVAEAAKAMATHRAHAVLVVGARNGTPLGMRETAEPEHAVAVETTS